MADIPRATPEAGRKAAEVVHAAMAEAFEKAGISTDFLTTKLLEELNAKETKFFQKDGVVIESRDVVAWDVRQKARQDTHKLLGHYPKESLELTLSKPILVITPANGVGGDPSGDHDGD
jgi:hypothetical protein